MNKVQQSYDAIANAYGDQFFHELDDKPLDRALLDSFAQELRAAGRVVDLGCGPGHVTRYLAERDVDCRGIDLSPGLVEQARMRCPEQSFDVGSMLALEIADRSLAGVAAFYAIVNLSRDEVVSAFREMSRVLRVGSPLLLSFHLGDEKRHVDEMFGTSVSLDFNFFPRAFIERALADSGFVGELWLERSPYAKEHPTRRAYVLARLAR